jgi:hypothetical protein
MKKTWLIILLAFFLEYCTAQTIVQKDAEIEQMLNGVSKDSLESYVNSLVKFGTRNTLSSVMDKKRGIGAAREWVLARFREFALSSAGRMTCKLDSTTLAPDGKRVNANTNLGNVMAILKGVDPADKRIFLISGHLDSRASDVMDKTIDAPGANDDGSGVAAVMECARIMSSHRFPATVIFVAVSGEEQGLLGSTYLAEQAKKNNWDIEGVLNNDIIGSSQGNETNLADNTRVRVFSEGLPAFELDKQAARIRSLGLENDGKSRQLARYIKETGERYLSNLEVVMIYRSDRFLRGGDHIPFMQRGFTAVRITEMNENYEHQHQTMRNENGLAYGDLPKFMDFEYLRKNTCLNLACLANLAKAPAPPEEVSLEVSQLSNSTHLFWKIPKSGKVKGYYILLRETTSASWQKKIYTSQTEMSLPISKDNYFFAVQSVSADGNESIAVTALPGK